MAEEITRTRRPRPRESGDGCRTAVVRVPERDALGRSYATGKRKDAVARVWIKPGNGKVVVNGKRSRNLLRAPVLRW